MKYNPQIEYQIIVLAPTHFEKYLFSFHEEYDSTIAKKYHKGEVNLGGKIVLSWKKLKDGFSCHADGIQLGLHEKAHALRLINIDEKIRKFYFTQTVFTFTNSLIPR